MKKVYNFLIILMLVSVLVFPIGLSEYKNEDLCETISEENMYRISEKFSDSFDYPVMDETIENLDLYPESPKPEILNNIPDEFSWLNHNGEDWTSPIRNQGNCGSCWAFGALGIIESIININENHADLDPDLSEQYIISCLPESGSCRGGSSYQALRYIKDTGTNGNNCNGVIQEHAFPYQGIDSNGCDADDCFNDPVLCSEKDHDWEETLIPILDYGYWNTDGSSSDIEAIKSRIFQYGPVVTSMYVTNEFQEWVRSHHDPTEYFPYTGEEKYINHCVVLVGWKDDSSIPNGGYWICKNSWGEFSGYNGFFNIEYNSLNIDKTSIIWVDYDPASYDWPPVVKVDGPYNGHINEPIQLDASESFDCEGNIVSYSWDFGDGQSATGDQVSHSYTQRGLYTISLEITDETGQQTTSQTYALIDFWLPDESWDFEIDTFELEYSKDEKMFHFHGSLPNVQLSVVEETEDHYQLSFDGSLRGSFTVDTGIGILTGTLNRFTRISGDVVMKKSDLSIEDIDASLKGLIRLSFGTGPLSLPVPFNVGINMDFLQGYHLIQLPVIENSLFTIPSSTIRVDGDISSILLRIVNIANLLTGNNLLPSEISSLLPVIDIGELFDFIGMGDELLIPSLSDVQYHEEEEVTVEAGTFTAYKLSTPNGFHYYFAPESGTIIEMNSNQQTFNIKGEELIFSVHGELVSTTYGD